MNFSALVIFIFKSFTFNSVFSSSVFIVQLISFFIPGVSQSERPDIIMFSCLLDGGFSVTGEDESLQQQRKVMESHGWRNHDKCQSVNAISGDIISSELGVTPSDARNSFSFGIDLTEFILYKYL